MKQPTLWRGSSVELEAKIQPMRRNRARLASAAFTTARDSSLERAPVTGAASEA